MSVDVASHSHTSESTNQSDNNHMIVDELPQSTTNGRRSGVLNVWTTTIQHSLLEVDDEGDSQYSSRKPSAVSSLEDQLDEDESKQDKTSQTSYQTSDCRSGESELHQRAFEAAVHLLDGITEDNRRKTSDPIISKRRAEMNTHRIKKQRCFSDTTGIINCTTAPPTNVIIDDTSSAVGCDSGIVDYMVHQSNTALSEPECSKTVNDPQQRRRRQTPVFRSGSLDEVVFRKLQQDESSSTSGGSSNKARQRRGNLTKHLSLSSMGGSSDNYSLLSFFDIMSDTMTTDLLSSLGFGDFDSPSLIPDRFIPQEAEAAKPSVMLEQTLIGVYSTNTYPEPQVSCSAATSITDLRQDFDLPLGATADNFIPTKLNRSLSPPLSPPKTPPPILPPSEVILHHTGTDPSFSMYNRKHIQLETVPEETASDLSPSPRWLSPRVSLDHSAVLDLSAGQLGVSLNVANRKRSLPNREGYRMSMESLLSEQDSTVYFSITSYDDDIAKEHEDATLHLPLEDSTVSRRRRRGVHHAPPELLSWLQDQILPQDDEELPWPFNERAKIRRSLTEYQQQQRLSHSSNSTLEDCSLSPTEDPLEGVFQRRFSINGPLIAPHDLNMEKRRLSLPSSSSYGHLKSRSPAPPSKGTALDFTIDEECSRSSPEFEEEEEVQYQRNTRLPPGMTREEAREYKRETNVLKTELNIAHQKLRDAERVRRTEEETHFKHISDTEEWLQSELWASERKRRELEEEFERVNRDYKLLQQNQQISIARAKEDTRDAKNKEIAALKHKMEQKNTEFKEKVSKLEEECRYLRNKETQLLKKANQHALKAENEELQKELARVKEHLRHEKQLAANTGKEKASEIKQLRTKGQLEKEEALKNQKEYLTKIHQTELVSLRQLVHQSTSEKETLAKPSRSFHASSPSKLEAKKLQYQIDKMAEELHCKEQEIAEMALQLKILHKEHLQLEKVLKVDSEYKTIQ